MQQEKVFNLLKESFIIHIHTLQTEKWNNEYYMFVLIILKKK